jgi:protease-4
VFLFAASPGGTVAIVPVSGGIDGDTAASVTVQLQQARQDPDVDAVVLLANSPGGGASASETLYLEVARTAEQMPVVASVDALAASGAYYAAVPADRVYTKPSSLVGSVGVFTSTPNQLQPIDEVIASGPDKLSGGSQRDWLYKTESLRRAFVGAVYENRGENITLSRAELSQAGLYTGAQAVDRGLADEIGGLSAAIRDAAQRADLEDYDVEVLRGDATATFLTRAAFVASDAPDKRMVEPGYFVGSPADAAAPNVVMLPPSVVAAAVDDDARARAAANGSTGGGADGTASGTPDGTATPPAAVGEPAAPPGVVG